MTRSYPQKPVPPGAWDTHHHIFETDRFPLSPNRDFTPARATLTQLQDFEKSIGVEHVCVAHSLAHGPDCTSLLSYLDTLAGTARGICVLDIETVTDDILDKYHSVGIRSVRLNFPELNAMHDVEAQVDLIQRTAKRLVLWRQDTNWTVQIQQPHVEFWPRLREAVLASPVPVVVDHFALVVGSSYRVGDDKTNIQDVSYLSENERVGLQALCQTLREGKLWIKLSAPYRCSNMDPGYADLQWLTRRFVDANRERVVWASDWPHTQRHGDQSRRGPMEEEGFLQIDNNGWIEAMSRWLSEEEWRAMWVDNPARLYDSRQ